MALSHYSTRRFFAAFYRWSLHTQHSRTCQSSCYTSRRRTLLAANSSHARAFSRLCSLQEQTNAQEETSAEGPSDEAIATLRLKADVRQLLRNVPSSVAVITACHKDPQTDKYSPLGVAVSSVTSVTLEPPTLSFNIKHPSKTLDAIRANKGRFRIHYFSGNLGAARVIEHFSTGNHPDAYRAREKELKLVIPRTSKGSKASPSSATRITDDSVRAGLECTVTHELPVADHVILAARVDSIEQKDHKSQTLIYVQGSYYRPSSDIISSHRVSGKSTSSIDIPNVIWDFPIILKDQHRQQYAEAIMALLKSDSFDLTQPKRQIMEMLHVALPYSPVALGINMSNLVTKCLPGSDVEPKKPSQNAKVLDDFYGRLGPAARAVILDRAERLVKELPLALEMDCSKFYQTLGISPSCKDLLPSDITKHLRAKGLLGAYEELDQKQDDNERRNLLQLETFEYRLREFYTSEITADKFSLTSALNQLGASKWTSRWFYKLRSRLISEAVPQIVKRANIRGDMTEVETRVVISRIVYFLHIRSSDVFREKIIQPAHEILRAINVDPTVAGLDVEFFLARIEHLHRSTRAFRELGPAVDRMLEPLFAHSIEWQELQDRVRQFVRAYPLRATTWFDRDRFAALGLYERVEIQVPDQVLGSAKPDSGRIIDMMIAKELKSHYGSGSETENRAIAVYLKDRYDFDIVYNTAEVARGLASGSSSDTLLAAMLANRSIDVSKGASHQASHSPTIRKFYHAPKGTPHSDSIRDRIKTGASLSTETHVEGKQASEGKTTGWSAYSLNGAKKDTQAV